MRRRKTVLTLIALLGLGVLVTAAVFSVHPLRESWYLAKLDSEDPDERDRAIEALVQMRSVGAASEFLRRCSESFEGGTGGLYELSDGEIFYEYVDENDKGTLSINFNVDDDIFAFPDEAGAPFLCGLVRIGEPAFEFLLNEFAREPEAETRKPCLQVALRILAKVSVRTLGRGLRHPGEAVRWKCARLLFTLGRDAQVAAPELIEALYDENEMIRFEVTLALARLGPGADALEALAERLWDSRESDSVRYACALALTSYGEEARAELRREPEPGDRVGARAVALARQGVEELAAIEPPDAGLTTRRGPAGHRVARFAFPVRNWTWDYWDDVASAVRTETEQTESSFVSSLRRLLHDDWNQRDEAVRELGSRRASGEIVIPFLLWALETHQGPSAAWALGRLGLQGRS